MPAGYRNSAENFWSMVDKSGGAAACWPWLGSRTATGGYGQVGWASFDDTGVAHGPRRAHRVALSLHLGRPIIPGKVVRHVVCDNPPCCNPAHLAEGSDKENSTDMVRHGRIRSATGSAHPGAKLTEQQAGAMIARYREGGVSFSALGREFGVSRTLAHRVVSGVAWRHLSR